MLWSDRGANIARRDDSNPAAHNVLAIAGSLRRGSLNRRLVRAAREAAPSGLCISDCGDLNGIPLFNEDLESGGGPKPVAQLCMAVRRSDGVLIATPEYNQSMPGVVKNLVDWLSRATPEVLAGKPVALMGATVGPWGTRLAQAALRHTLTSCGALIMPTPQFFLRDAEDALDRSGKLRDEQVNVRLTDFLAAFRQWIEATRAHDRNGGGT